MSFILERNERCAAYIRFWEWFSWPCWDGNSRLSLTLPYDDFDKVLPHRWIGTDANANNACLETSHQRRGNDIRKHIGRPLKREVSVSLANDCDAHEPRCLTGDEARQVCGLHWVLAAAHCRPRLGR